MLKNVKISKNQFCPVLAALSRVCQVASLSRTFAGHFWRLVREWKVQSRGSLRDFRGSACDLLAGRPSSREKHLEKFSEFCSCVLWRLELATVWRLNPVAKIACFAEIRAVFKSFSVFPSNFCDYSSSPSPNTPCSHFQSPLLNSCCSKSSSHRYGFSVLHSFLLDFVFFPLIFRIYLCFRNGFVFWNLLLVLA